jgi:GNAT superfamily N-acetyltransferase
VQLAHAANANWRLSCARSGAHSSDYRWRMPAITVRPAHPAEHAALGELTVAAYPAVRATPRPRRRTSGRFATWAPGRGTHVLVAVDADGGLLGDVTYVPGPGPLAELEEEGDAGIRMLGVSPAAQRGAIGRRLVEACVARARDDGRSRIVLHTAPR